MTELRRNVIGEACSIHEWDEDLEYVFVDDREKLITRLVIQYVMH
jgi:hypothetical protein